jgi:hypothetical protein
MNQIVYNSFPRAGNVYSGSLSSIFFDSMFATVHIPEIFSVKELDNVTIFRKPEDAISSLINKQSQSSIKIDMDVVTHKAISGCELYKSYMNYAKINKDKIYIGRFEDLIGDTVKHFENVAKKFNRDLNLDYESKFKNAKFLGKIWDDRYDGHVPRDKDEIRLDIEKKVESLDIIKELNKEYEEFIFEYQTKIK